MVVASENENLKKTAITACRICFHEGEGSHSHGRNNQCQGAHYTCSGWSNTTSPAWTLPFRDDTDNRPGGCKYQWKIQCKWSATSRVSERLPTPQQRYLTMRGADNSYLLKCKSSSCSDRETARFVYRGLAKTCPKSTKLKKCLQNWRKRCPGTRFPWRACISNMPLWGWCCIFQDPIRSRYKILHPIQLLAS